MSYDSNQIRVSKRRWNEAQKWEENCWIETERARSRFGKAYLWRFLAQVGLVPRSQGNDWNDWWKSKFQNYDFLPASVDNAIELGCGPYSNMRLVGERCKANHVFLSDPLVRTYINFKNGFVSQMYRTGFVTIDDHPIEECPFAQGYFDLTVIINVLDHVQDAQLCVENAISITKPGGFLILGQDLSNEDDIKLITNSEGEIGHPIRVDHAWLDELITERFDPIIHRIMPREESRNPDHHYGTYIFAGRKRQ